MPVFVIPQVMVYVERLLSRLDSLVSAMVTMEPADADNVPFCSDPWNCNRVDINVEILVGNLIKLPVGILALHGYDLALGCQQML